MGRLRNAALILAVAPALGGCSSYPDFEWSQGTPWAQAQQRALLGEATDRGGSRPLEAGPGRHLVMPGDTVSGLAQRYGVPMQQIVRLNGLAPPYRIYVGQVLQIGMPPRPGGRVHRVRRGEVLSHIARRYDLPLHDLVAANPGIDPNRLLVGQRIRIPGPQQQPALVPVAQRTEGGEDADPQAPPPVPPEAYRRAAETAPPPLSRAGFLWPVEGQVVARFGAKPNGLRNDGVNIAAPEGTPVRAAESGVVVYAGEAIPAFGRMLMLRHDGGWLTAYAHNASLLVTVGDVVRRGQVIARVGATGDVSSPQLHFQVRKGTEPVDPVSFLSSSRQFAQR